MCERGHWRGQQAFARRASCGNAFVSRHNHASQFSLACWTYPNLCRLARSSTVLPEDRYPCPRHSLFLVQSVRTRAALVSKWHLSYFQMRCKEILPNGIASSCKCAGSPGSHVCGSPPCSRHGSQTQQTQVLHACRVHVA